MADILRRCYEVLQHLAVVLDNRDYNIVTNNDLTGTVLYITLLLMYRIDDIANVAQGLSIFGRGVGVRFGELKLQMVESADLGDSCWVTLDELREIEVANYSRIERHLLRPYDVLVTARAGYVQAGLVPPGVSRTVASVTLLVVQPHDRDWGMGTYIWYFLTSAWGQAQVKRRLTVSSTLTSLSATNLGEVELPIPVPQDLDRIASLAEASEEAYARTVEAAGLRRDSIRDSVIGTLDPQFNPRV